MTTLSLVVPTFRRPTQLTSVLTHVAPQITALTHVRDRREGIYEAEIVVIDNDPAGSARATLESWVATAKSFMGSTDGGLPLVRYLHEPEPGIAAVRNQALTQTRGRDVLVFLDDDVVPDPDWLEHLVHAWEESDAVAVAGPVRSAYPDGVATWVRSGPFHEGPSLPDGASMTHAATTSLLLDRRLVERLGIRFPTLGTRGGEDSYFTQALTDAGATLRWCAKAAVTEPVPPSRTTPRWVVERSLGNGLTWGSMLTSRPMGTAAPYSLPRRLTVSASGAARVAAGVGTTLVGLGRRSPAQVGLGVHRASRGVGITLGAWDWIHDEYARPGTRRWRREIAER